MNRRRARGSLERQVLEVLWGMPDGATTGDVLERLGDDLAYTTITTILVRLADKGLATRERRGRVHVYRAVNSEADLTAQRMREILEPSSDRTLALSRFVDGLSKRDEAALRRILDELDQ